MLTPSPGPGDGNDALSITVQQARARVALASLPDSVRRSLTRFWPGRLWVPVRHGRNTGGSSAFLAKARI